MQQSLQRGQQRNQQSNPEQVPSGPFNDDDELLGRMERAKGGEGPEAPADPSSRPISIRFDMRMQRTLVKVKENVVLPAMASLVSEGGSRTNVDLFCVIDVSGSMSGEKIALVKETLAFMLDMLTPQDRISLITFENSGHRLCPLKSVSEANLPLLNRLIAGLAAGGGTNINSGLTLATKSIRERRQANMVTSIFLLSDGQDGAAFSSFKQELSRPENVEQAGVYTLHSFGFGNDHDEDLMTKLAQLKDGTFYYVKEPSMLDEAFSNALGGIISVIASELTLNISRVGVDLGAPFPAPNISQVRISKTYGPMWRQLPNGDYEIRQLQLLSGSRKDFVFEVEIPYLDFLIMDLDRNHEVFMAAYAAKLLSGKVIDGETRLSITLLNPEEVLEQEKEDMEVVENHLRVRAAEVMELGVTTADQRKYKEAQDSLDAMINVIEANPRVRREKMSQVVEDLRQVRQKCSEKEYAGEGRKMARNAMGSHWEQKNFGYSNAVQTDMVNERRSRK